MRLILTSTRITKEYRELLKARKKMRREVRYFESREVWAKLPSMQAERQYYQQRIAKHAAAL